MRAPVESEVSSFGDTTPIRAMTPSSTADTNFDFDDSPTTDEELKSDNNDVVAIMEDIDELFDKLPCELRATALTRQLEKQAAHFQPQIGSTSHPSYIRLSSFLETPYVTPYPVGNPDIVVALKGFSTVAVREKRNDIYVSPANYKNTAFELQFGTTEIGPARMKDVHVDWLELQIGHTKEGLWQHGVWRWGFAAEKYITKDSTVCGNINFTKPFNRIPKVVAFLSGFRTHSEHALRFEMSIKNVTTTGFQLGPTTWLTSIIHRLTITWVAYSSDIKAVHSGTVLTSSFRTSKQPQQVNMGYEAFPAGVFSKPPKVMVGLSYLDLERNKEQNVNGFVSEVTQMGMCWNTNSWGKTVNYNSGLSYLAIEY